MINMNPESMNCIYSDGRIIHVNRAFLALLAADKYGDVHGKMLNDMSPSIDSAFLRESIKGEAGYDRRDAVERDTSGGERQLQFGVVRSGRDREWIILIVNNVTEKRKEGEILEKSYKVKAVQAVMGALMCHLNQPQAVLMVIGKVMSEELEDGAASTDDFKSALATSLNCRWKW